MSTTATNVCPFHGEHSTLICVTCYALQQERVERESEPLRYANTAQAIRQRALALMNGHGSATNGLLSTEKTG